MADMDPMGESAAEPSSPATADMPMDDFGHAITEAFPNEDWTPERLSAMKEAIHSCFDEYESKPHEEYGSGGGEEKKPGGLALIFGGPKKKG